MIEAIYPVIVVVKELAIALFFIGCLAYVVKSTLKKDTKKDGE